MDQHGQRQGFPLFDALTAAHEQFSARQHGPASTLRLNADLPQTRVETPCFGCREPAIGSRKGR